MFAAWLPSWVRLRVQRRQVDSDGYKERRLLRTFQVTYDSVTVTVREQEPLLGGGS